MCLTNKTFINFINFLVNRKSQKRCQVQDKLALIFGYVLCYWNVQRLLCHKSSYSNDKLNNQQGKSNLYHEFDAATNSLPRIWRQMQPKKLSKLRKKNNLGFDITISHIDYLYNDKKVMTQFLILIAISSLNTEVNKNHLS